MVINIRYIRLLSFFALATVASEANAQVQPGSQEANADWIARATSSSAVLYATNFDDVYLDGKLDNSRSSINSQADLLNEAQEPPPNPSNIALNSSRVLSGANSLELITLGSAGSSSSGSWAFRPDGRTPTPRNDIYVQVSVYYPKETIGYRFDHDGDSYLKTINFGQYGAGQVVVGDVSFSGFPTLLVNGTKTLGNYNYFYSSSDTPWGMATTRENPAIDNGQTLTSNSSKEAWLNNYGVMPRGVASQDGDYSYNANDPYLYARSNMPNGWPDSRVLQSGAVPWQRDGWTTIEAHLVYNGPNDSSIQIWAAPYGEAPKLIVDEIGTAPLGSSTTNTWSRIELLNYATGRSPDASRPTQYTFYDEVIVSGAPIDFPGGYDLSASTDGGGTGGGGTSVDLSTKDAPGWVTNIAPGTWSAVSLNTLADVDPEDDPQANPNYPGDAPWHGNSGQSAVIDAWNGATLAEGYGSRGSLIAYGGGHGDYYGSEIYAFDLETRLWTRLTNPYPGPFNWPYNTGEYPDGSAIPPHTYDYVDYHPGTNSFIVMKGQNELGPPSNQTSVDIPHMFDFDTMEWRRGAENKQKPQLFSGGYSAYDSRRDMFWAEGGNGGTNFVAFDPNSDNADGTFGSWQTYPLKISITDSQAEYDPRNDILLVAGFRNESRVAAIDLSQPTNNEKFLNETGDIPEKDSANGWSWSKLRQSVLYIGRNSGADVHELKHQSGEWDTGQWVWHKLTQTSNSLVPLTSNNGIYGRFQVVSYRNAEIAVMFSDNEGPVYAFRIPSVVQPMPPDQLR